MKNYVLKFGSLAGLILILFLLIGPISNSCGEDMTLSMILGFGGMIIAFSMAYFGVKFYRDKELNGAISFVKALWTALSITFFASLFYVLAWGIYVYGFNPEWGNKYHDMVVQEIQKDEALSYEEKELKIKENEEFMESYKNPFYFSLVTYSEPIIPAITISLIVALITTKKRED